MTATKAPRRYILSDGKGRPSWADEQTWIAYERVTRQANERGFDAVSCGWALQPTRHGEMRVARPGTNESITVTADTPGLAVMSMEFLLDRLEDADAYRDRRDD